jgi:hypothetical protein
MKGSKPLEFRAFQVVVDDPAELDRFGGRHSPPGEREQVLDDGGGLFPRFLDRQNGVAERALFGQVQQQQFGIADQSGQDVVQIVGDSGGEGADGFHLLRIPKLVFQLFSFPFDQLPLGDVHVGAGHADRRAVLAPLDHLAAVHDPYPVPVFVTHPQFALIDGTLAGEMLQDKLVGRFQVIGVGEPVPRFDAYGVDFL